MMMMGDDDNFEIKSSNFDHSLSSRKTRTGVNFINILCVHFSYESELSRFSLIPYSFAIFWHQNIGIKCWWNWHQGSISPNFVCLEKICKWTEFGKKIAVQLHKHSAWICADEICPIRKVKFAKLMCLPN